MLFKSGKRLLEILILVALIVVIFLWNPFGIFGRGSKIQPTANMVSHIQEMGQLVTAEYYGEVIASLDEARLDLLTEDTVNTDADELYIDTKRILFDICMYDTLSKKDRESFYNDSDEERKIKKPLYKESVSKRNVELKFKHFKSDIKNYKDEDTLLCYLVQERLGEKIKKGVKKELENHKEELLFSLIQEIKKNFKKLKPAEFSDYLNEGLVYVNKYSDFLYKQRNNGLPKKEEKKELVMIGRGWVKAGINFERLNENNFYFDKDRGVVHFFGLKTEILNKDINPWFIPEREIPGFQIITYNRLVEFEDSKKVKEYCIRKLEDYALKANILTQARENAIEALKSFFSLVSGTEVKSVVFHENELGNQLEKIAKDKKIDYEEALSIDSIAKREIEEIKLLEKDSLTYYGLGFVGKKKQLLKIFLSKLQKFDYAVNGKLSSFNFYTLKTESITKDTLLDQSEIAFIEALRWPIIKSIKKGSIDSFIFKLPIDIIENQVWFEEPYMFIDQYNLFLSRSTNSKPMKLLLSKREKESITKVDINDLKSRQEKGEISDLSIDKDTVYFTSYCKEPLKDTTLCKRYYAIKYNPIEINALIENNSLKFNKNNEITRKTLLNPAYASKGVDSLFDNHKREYFVLFNYAISERNKIYPSDNSFINTYSRVKKRLKDEKERLVVELKSLGR